MPTSVSPKDVTASLTTCFPYFDVKGMHLNFGNYADLLQNQLENWQTVKLKLTNQKT